MTNSVAELVEQMSDTEVVDLLKKLDIAVAGEDTYDARYDDPVVLISGQGRSGIGRELRAAGQSYGYRVVSESEWDHEEPIAIAVCLYGSMVVDYTERVKPEELEQMVYTNYVNARGFSEMMIDHWLSNKRRGYLIIVGSIAARYGNPGAVDYAAMKAAINKYAELRGREVRNNKIRITVVNFGGVNSSFWREAERWPEDVRKNVMPDPSKALEAIDAAEYLLSLFSLPERVVVKDCIVVSQEYQ